MRPAAGIHFAYPSIEKKLILIEFFKVKYMLQTGINNLEEKLQVIKGLTHNKDYQRIYFDEDIQSKISEFIELMINIYDQLEKENFSDSKIKSLIRTMKNIRKDAFLRNNCLDIEGYTWNISPCDKPTSPNRKLVYSWHNEDLKQQYQEEEFFEFSKKIILEFRSFIS